MEGIAPSVRLFSAENCARKLSDWVKIEKKQVKCEEYCESHNCNEQEDSDSDEHLDCDWKRVEF